MTDHPLRPAARADLRAALSYALRYNRAGKATRDRTELMSDAAAEHIAEALERAGFVVMQRAPAPAHTGALPAHAVPLEPPRNPHIDSPMPDPSEVI